MNGDAVNYDNGIPLASQPKETQYWLKRNHLYMESMIVKGLIES